jgi:hypothetical protein
LPERRNSTGWWWPTRSETLYKDVIYALQYIAPKGSRSAASTFGKGSFTMWRARLPWGDIVERVVVPLFEKMGVDAVTTWCR